MFLCCQSSLVYAAGRTRSRVRVRGDGRICITWSSGPRVRRIDHLPKDLGPRHCMGSADNGSDVYPKTSAADLSKHSRKAFRRACDTQRLARDGTCFILVIYALARYLNPNLACTPRL